VTSPLVSRPPYGEGQQHGFIYLVTNTVNEKKYVGWTSVSIPRRWVQHKSAARKASGFALHAAIRKYGEENFKIVCLEVVAGGIDALREAEIRHIQELGCVAPQGYNLTRGGEGVDYNVPGVRERHLRAMQALSLDPVWRENLKHGIIKRQADPAWKELQLIGARCSGMTRRSPDCTLCGVPLTEANSSKRSWCLACKKEYHRSYDKTRQKRLGGGP
jgi:group I intron endonuclease